MVLKISVLAGNTVTRWLLSKSMDSSETACNISSAAAAEPCCISVWPNRGNFQKLIEIRLDIYSLLWYVFVL